MEVSGRVEFIGATQEVSATFSKRELVVTTNETYPQSISIEFNKCSLLDKVNVGDDVTVGVNLRGRKWVNPQGESKYFNTIQGWKIDKADVAKSPEPVQDLPF